MLSYGSRFIVIATALVGCSGDPTAPGGAAGSDAGNTTGSDAGGGDTGTALPPPPFTNGTSTVSGGAEAGDIDGARGVARFADPVNVALRDGKLYVADFDNGKIRVIDTASDETTTLISQPGFQRPFGLALAADGTLYVSTDNDPRGGHSLMSGSIWRIAPGARTAVPIAGSIGRPRGLVVLPDGRLAASDYAHHVIELVDPASGAVTTLAGTWDQPGFADQTGAAARFTSPYGLVLYRGDTLAVADFDNHRIRLVTLAGVVTTLAGSGAPAFADGPAATAMFHRPQGLAIDQGGDLYVTDTENYRVRRITGSTVETVAGDGTGGYLDTDDPLACQLYGLEGLAVTGDAAMLYVADGSRGEPVPYNRIRQVVKHW